MVDDKVIENGVFTFGPFRLAAAARRLERAGTAVQLGGRAFDILNILIERAGDVVSKRELLARVWHDVTVDEGSLRFHVGALRKALGDEHSDPKYITNVPGRGYCFVAPVVRLEPQMHASTNNSAAHRTGSLPPRLTRMVGRDDSVQAIAIRLRAHRFVNIVGPGGNGKTTVALSVAHALLDQFAGSIHFIGLGSLNDPNLVTSTVAYTLGVPVDSGNAIPTLIAYLRDKQLLLILDNCEHVIDVVSDLAERIFMEAPQVHILATSREPMRVEGEQIYRLFPLDYPPNDSRLTAAEAMDFPAVQLFMERVTANSDRPPLRDHEAATVAEICRRLDGIPLAMEFAAALVATLGISTVAAHLNDRFALLVKGRRTALPRHQTLRATLDWSYELLVEDERSLLRRLAVFSGGFTLEAATAVMADEHGDMADIAERISSLIAKSLLTSDGATASDRWRLLETTRAYALEKLGNGAELQQAARRHAEFFRDLFAAIETGSKIEALTENLASYRQEIDNVRSALDWSFSPGGDPSIGAVLASAYSWIWMRLSLYYECSERAGQALERLGPGSGLTAPQQLQLLLTLAMSLMNNMGPVARIKAILVTALAIAESSEELGSHLWILWAVWILQLSIGECGAAQITAERYAHIAPRTQDAASILPGLRLLGTAKQLSGDQPDAQRHLERALEPPFSEIDPKHPVWPRQHRAMVLATLVRTYWLRGFSNQARLRAEQSFSEVNAGLDGLTRFEVLRLAVCPVAFLTNDLAAAEKAVAMITHHAASTSAALWKITAQCFESQLLVRNGDFEKGVNLLRPVLDTCHRTGWKPGYPEYLGVLAEGLAGLGRYPEATSTIDQALKAASHGGERWYVAELLRMKGELRLHEADSVTLATSERLFDEAMQLAQQQGALAWELRIASSLARLKIGQGQRETARDILEPVYRRFTEGFETSDLIGARSLLEKLA